MPEMVSDPTLVGPAVKCSGSGRRGAKGTGRNHGQAGCGSRRWARVSAERWGVSAFDEGSRTRMHPASHVRVRTGLGVVVGHNARWYRLVVSHSGPANDDSHLLIELALATPDRHRFQVE